jgi:hypothetical protein
MRRLLLSIRAFFRILFGREFASQVQALLEAPPPTPSLPRPQEAASPSQPAPTRVSRSEAITLLSALQREARFVDLVQEPLTDYSDEQIGAAARDVLRGCSTVLQRMFDLQPLVGDAENEIVETPEHFSAGRFRLTGNVVGQPPFRGRLVHHGWQAAKCELPQWSGDADAARVVAPAEIEL